MAVQRPNILLVMTDQQRADTIEALGTSFGAKTPMMDKFCKYGVAFENAFCTAPICAPSRSTIMSGLTPSQTGVFGNLGNPCSPMNERVITIGHRLQAAGYETVYHGKWHLGESPANHGWERVFENSHDQSTVYEAGRFWRNRDWLTYKRPFFNVVSLMDPHDIYFLDPDDTPTKHFEPWVNAKDPLTNKPWPHRHVQAKDWPAERWDLYREFYASRLERVDKAISDLFDELLWSGFANNTWIIFTSDHGDMGGEHGMAFKGPYLYDGVVRVPLVIVPPQERFVGKGNGIVGKSRYEGRRCGDLVSLMDIVPTIMDLAGVEADPLLRGKSLVPAVEGKPVGHEAVFAEWHQQGKMVTPARMVRTKKWKYVMYLGGGEELYDMEKDPAEMRNLLGEGFASADVQRVHGELRGRLNRMIEETGDKFYSYVPTDAEGKAWK